LGSVATQGPRPASWIATPPKRVFHNAERSAWVSEIWPNSSEVKKLPLSPDPEAEATAQFCRSPAGMVEQAGIRPWGGFNSQLEIFLNYRWLEAGAD